MASDKIINVTADNVDQAVLQSDKPVLVDFWAERSMTVGKMRSSRSRLWKRISTRSQYTSVEKSRMWLSTTRW